MSEGKQEMGKSNILKQIFSVKNSPRKTHKIITIAGVKIQVRYNRHKKKIADFMRLFKSVRANSVLIVEPNDCHYEVIPGYAKYLTELGYNVDIFVCNASQLDFLTDALNKVRVYSFGEVPFELLMETHSVVKNYKYILFNSSLIYFPGVRRDTPKMVPVADYLKHVAFDRERILFVQHHLEQGGMNENLIALADLHNQYSKKYTMVNSQYFGDIEITPKNEGVTRFIVVGNISPWRKNHSLLIDAVKNLKKVRQDFKVVLVGSGKLDNIDDEIAPYIELCGRLSYPDMFREMEKADFFLCLFDPENPDHHRYVSVGTSGSFQLIYAFAKPCIIHSEFAKVYEFHWENSLVYDHNGDLGAAMEKAAAMDGAAYRRMQEKVMKKAENIRRLSLNNLKELLKLIDEKTTKKD